MNIRNVVRFLARAHDFPLAAMLSLLCLIALAPSAFAQLQNVCKDYGGPYACTDPDRDLPEGEYVGWRVEWINDGKHCQVVDDTWKKANNGVRTFIAVTRHDHPSCPGGYVPFPQYVLGPNTIGINNCVSWPGSAVDNPAFYVNDCGYFPALMARDIKCSTGNLYYGLQPPAVCFHPGVLPPKNPRCEADGNPIVRALGIKSEEQVDLSGPIRWQRTYDSTGISGVQLPAPAGAGVAWHLPFQQRIQSQNFSASTVKVLRADGRWYIASLVGGLWALDADISDRLTENKNSSGQRLGWTYYEAASENVESYNAAGVLQSVSLRSGNVLGLAYNSSAQLASISDSFGNTLSLAYFSTSAATGAGLLQSITDRAGNRASYSYDGAGNLASVVLPDGASRQYVYAESALTQGAYLPNALTGIVDESGVRYASFGYDTQGRAISTEHAGGVQRYLLNYASPYAQTLVTDPLGTQRTYNFQTVLGVAKTIGVDQPCPSCGGTQSQATTYDANGNAASKTDFNGKKVCYAYDLARNLETTRVEGLLASEACSTAITTPPNRPDVRKTVTTWHTTYRLPLTITEPAAAATVGGTAGTKLTEFNYDGSGNLLQKDVTAPKNDGTSATEKRTWQWTYNTLGQVLTATDPLGNVTTTVYYAATDTANPPKWTKGDIQTVSNAAGHITTFNEYDRNGRLLKMTDPNGLVTTMAYHPRGWLTSRAVNNGTTTETTGYTYDDVGQLTRVTMPDGSNLFYAYDDAHRLVGKSDQLTDTEPQSTTVTLNPPGGTPYSVIVESLRVQLANLAGNMLVYTLDNMGNRVREDHYDPSGTLAKRKQRAVDSLNRLKQEIGGTAYATAAPGGAPAVDASVASPPANAAVTQYGYDNNGNLTTTTDPLGRVTQNNYDALNRLVSVIDPYNGSIKPTQYDYDKAGNLTRVTDPQGLATDYTYNGHNNLITQASPDTGTSKFAYNANGSVVTKFDAEGRCSLTSYDALNRVTDIRYFGSSNVSTNTAAGCAAATATTTTVEETVSYVYDGMIIPGQGGVVNLGRLFRATDSGGRLDYRYDLNGRVTNKSQWIAGADNPTQTVIYSYNAAGQLASMVTPSGQTVTYEYGTVSGKVPSQYPGKLIRISVNGVDVVKDTVYEPFGPNGGWSWGNHYVNRFGPINPSTWNQHLRVFDLDYRPTAIASDPEGYNRDLTWDRANRITGITVPGTSTNGPSITIPGLANAMSVNQSYGYDALDRLTSMSAGYPGATTLATGQGLLPAEVFTYDAIGNRLTRTAMPPGGSASTATYAYPNLPSTVGTKRHTLTGITGAQVNSYTYDLTGNTKTESAALGTAINPSTGIALSQTFDAKNRLKQIQIGSTAADTVTYKLNAVGQRYQKSGAGQFAYSTSTTVNTNTGLSPQAQSLAYNARYVYDEQGRLLGEYSPEGKLIAETIWFDDLPVATIRPQGANNQTPLGIVGTGKGTANNTGTNSSADPVYVDIFYLHPDHLGTPRVATRSAAMNGATTGPNAINKAVWRWESDPFGSSIGNSKPNENPQNVTGTSSQITASSFRVNNRFPGQVADAESGKYYNYFRDYDPSIGRYIESDPIGLAGGFSTFSYAGSTPTLSTDPSGLFLIIWQPDDPGLVLLAPPSKIPGKYHCRARCAMLPAVCPAPDCSGYSSDGYGIGNNLAEAMLLAKGNAMPKPGCQNKHCVYACVDPKGGKIFPGR